MATRKYELMYIINPNLSEEELNGLIEQVTSYAESNGCVITRVDRWGTRRLAYEVKKFREGYYVLMYFEADPQFIDPFKRWLSLNEAILKLLLVRSEADVQEETRAPADLMEDSEVASQDTDEDEDDGENIEFDLEDDLDSGDEEEE